MTPTRALYHEPGLTLHFTATVQAVQTSETLTPEIALDATAFYPESGGQSSDEGQLSWPGGAARVTHARKDKATGIIWHALDGDPPAPGEQVSGAVDAGRRWRHMQRHSGEHLLAQAFHRVNPVFQVAAVSMRGPECTLDLRGDPAESHVRAAENLLREVLGRQDLILHTPTVPEADLHHHPLRRETKVKDEVRLVIFQAEGEAPFDVSACGGTHVPRASMAAPVVVLRTERQKAGLTRVVFMAGEEAAAHLSDLYGQTRRLAQAFSVPVEGLPERVQALQDAVQDQRAAIEDLRGQLAAALLNAHPAAGETLPPLRALTLPDADLLLPVLTRVPAGEVVVAVTPEGRCGIASGHPEAHAGKLLRGALDRVGGKGGGRADLAQGQTPDPAAFHEAVRDALKQRG